MWGFQRGPGAAAAHQILIPVLFAQPKSHSWHCLRASTLSPCLSCTDARVLSPVAGGSWGKAGTVGTDISLYSLQGGHWAGM